jgi:hypothetical protein
MSLWCSRVFNACAWRCWTAAYPSDIYAFDTCVWCGWTTACLSGAHAFLVHVRDVTGLLRISRIFTRLIRACGVARLCVLIDNTRCRSSLFCTHRRRCLYLKCTSAHFIEIIGRMFLRHPSSILVVPLTVFPIG